MKQIAKESKRILLFQLAFVIYLAATVLQTSTFVELAIWNRVLTYARYLAFALLLVKLTLDVTADFWDGERIQLRRGQMIRWGRCIVAVLVFAIAAWRSGDNNLLYLIVFLVAAPKVPIRSLFRLFLCVQLLCFAVIVVSSLCGVISNLQFIRSVESRVVRYALGYSYPSVMVSYFIFALCVYLWLQDRKLRLGELLILEAANLILFLITNARMGAAVGALIPVALQLIDTLPRKQLVSSERIKKLGRAVYQMIPLILMVVTILLCFCANTGMKPFLDRLFTKRFSYAYSAMKTYGLSFLGQPIDWIGYGGSSNTFASDAVYNFVDCSYLHDLLNYGILVMAFVILASVWVMRQMLDFHISRNRKVILMVVFFYCVIEPRFLELHNNVFLFLAVGLLQDGWGSQNSLLGSFAASPERIQKEEGTMPCEKRRDRGLSEKRTEASSKKSIEASSEKRTEASSEQLISVIIPVYRTAPQDLAHCLKSIQEQTWKQLEVLVVMDEETQQYQEVFQEYEGKLCLRVLQQEHQGVSAARNYGIRKSRGHYVFFSDADDSLEPQALEQLCNAAEEYRSPIVIGEYYSCYGEERVVHSYQKEACLLVGELKKQYAGDVLRPQTGAGFVWGKLFLREWLLEQHLFFQPELAAAEDAEFMLRAVCSAERVYYWNQPVYCYRFHEQSAVRSFREDYPERYELSMEKIAQYLQEHEELSWLEQPLQGCIVYHLLLIAVNYSFHPEQRGGLRQQIRAFAELVKKPMYQNALKQVSYHDFSWSRRVTVFCIQSHFYLGVAIIAAVRHRQLRRKRG